MAVDRSEPYFVRRCVICGIEIQTPWGPEVHADSAYSMRRHLDSHADHELVQYARKEALRGL
jgi:hypothetical protein